MSKLDWDQSKFKDKVKEARKTRITKTEYNRDKERKLLLMRVFNIKDKQVRAKSEKQAWLLYFRNKRSDNSCCEGIIGT